MGLGFFDGNFKSKKEDSFCTYLFSTPNTNSIFAYYWSVSLENQGRSLEKNYHESQIKLLHFLWNVYKREQKQGVVDLNTSELTNQKYS